ncbi:MAG: hypothetical protein WCY65_02385 [Candidatus Methanomethylophilaceae archaeon]
MDWNCSTTLIGSLPFEDPAKALDLIVEEKIICAPWPQLPRLGYRESMYSQTAARLPGLVANEKEGQLCVDLGDYDPMEFYTALLEEDIDYFQPPSEGHQGLYAFLERDHSSHLAVKGQVTGPVSEGLQIFDREGRPVVYDESYGEIVRKGVNMYARWQQRRLSGIHPNVVMFFDEPSLTLLGTPFASISADEAVSWLNEAMEGVDCHKAIHCCGNTDWPMVLRTDLDILSFDAYSYAHTLALYPQELAAFLEGGGSLCWGIVPNSDEGVRIETAESLFRLMEKHLDGLVAKGLDRDLLQRRCMLSPQCGLGGMEEPDAVAVLRLLRELSDLMRERYGLS